MIQEEMNPITLVEKEQVKEVQEDINNVVKDRENFFETHYLCLSKIESINEKNFWNKSL